MMKQHRVTGFMVVKSKLRQSGMGCTDDDRLETESGASNYDGFRCEMPTYLICCVMSVIVYENVEANCYFSN